MNSNIIIYKSNINNNINKKKYFNKHEKVKPYKRKLSYSDNEDIAKERTSNEKLKKRDG